MSEAREKGGHARDANITKKQRIAVARKPKEVVTTTSEPGAPVKAKQVQISPSLTPEQIEHNRQAFLNRGRFSHDTMSGNRGAR